MDITVVMMDRRAGNGWELFGVFVSAERAIMAFNDEKKMFPTIKGKSCRVSLGQAFSQYPPSETML